MNQKKNQQEQQQKAEDEFDAEATRKSAMKTGVLTAVIAWLGIGGWAGHGCHSCVESGSALAGTLGFVFVGVISAFLIGMTFASIVAFAVCWKAESSLGDAADLFEEVCWENEEIVIAAMVVSFLGGLLVLSVLTGAVFSFIL